MKRTRRVVVGLLVLAIIANLVLHVIVIDSVRPVPLTVYVYDADDNRPLPGIVVYYALYVDTEPHILGVPTFQTDSSKVFRQRAYTDDEGRATFVSGTVMLHVWENMGGEYIRVNYDAMIVPDLSYGFGPDAFYRPNPNYEGRLLVTPRLLPESRQKRYPYSGWDLAVLERQESGTDMAVVGLQKYERAASGPTAEPGDAQMQDPGGSRAK